MSDELALALDRIAQTKGIALRCLRAESSLLRDALDALQKGKLHVVRDHLERAIESMDRCASKLPDL